MNINLLKNWKKIPNKVKWPVLAAVIIIVIALAGYFVIVFGGRLVVNESDLILDKTSTVELEDGKVIAELYHENRNPVSIENVPEHVKNAFIAIEDRRFYEHAGVDFRSVTRAVMKDILALHKVEGASTITQQLSKNLFLSHDKTWMRKTKEVMASIYLERKFTKDEILELYLNDMYFGQGVYGIETASQLFFSKSVNELTLSEGALLAGLAKAPNGYSPVQHPEKALTRRNTVLKSMRNARMISAKKCLQAQGKTLGLNITKQEMKPWADSYVDLVMKEASSKYHLSIDELQRGGYRIVTNMNETAQKIAYQQFQKNDYFPGNTKGVQGAFTMMNQANGGIIAAIGGRDYQLGELNRATVKRQPGSTMKPISVYAPAMMTGNYHPYSLISDQLITYEGNYTAANYDNNYDQIVSIYDALIMSKNAPAVWLLDQIGVETSKKYLEKMGFSLSDNGLSIALGGLREGLTPIDMMKAYRTFDHAGEMIDTHTIKYIYDSDGEMLYQEEPETKQLFNVQTAWNMTEMLKSVVTDGTGKAGHYSKELAGKTGSTQHPFVNGKNKDVWFVGYTPEYVTALWMGYDRSDKEHYLTGGSDYPTKLTKKILSEFNKQETLQAEFEKPINALELPKPIKLPESVELKADVVFGGFSLLQGKLTWSAAKDKRIMYHIYKEQPGIDERVGEVTGDNKFIIKNIPFMRTAKYYVVPYNPLTKMEGKRSNIAELNKSILN